MIFFNSLAVIFVLSPSIAFAFDVSRDFDLSAAEYADLDNICLDAFESEIVPEFVGLNGIEALSPSFFFGLPERATLLTYAGVGFQSDFGTAKGTLNCIFEGRSNRMWTINVTFEGRGLAGFKKHPMAEVLNDPAQQRALSYGSDILE